MATTALRESPGPAVEQMPGNPAGLLDKVFCDACHAPGRPEIARAYVLFQLPTGQLALCSHHANLYQARIAALGGAVVVDERYQLSRPRAVFV